MIATAPQPPVIEYPSSDGAPMAETGTHVESIYMLRESLLTFYAGRADVLVTTDQFLYWEQGSARRRRSPDIMIIPGVASGLVDRYCIWEHAGTIPAAVFEFSSAGTVARDLGVKRRDYRRIGIAEYFLFDPSGLHLNPSFQGFRLRGTRYVPIRPVNGAMESRLGFTMTPEGIMLRVRDSATGTPVLLGRELAAVEQQRADAEQQKAEAEKARADSLEAKVARLQALLQQHNIPSGNGS